MKRIYYLLILSLMLFVGCDGDIGHRNIDTIEHLYLCNVLGEKVTLELFKDSEVFKYELNTNDTIYWHTVYSGYCSLHTRSVHFPPETDYWFYVGGFDSATVSYNSLLYTFGNVEYRSHIPYDSLTRDSILNEMEYRRSIYTEDMFRENKPTLSLSWYVPEKESVSVRKSYSEYEENSYLVFNEKYFERLENKIWELFVIGEIDCEGVK